MKYRSYQRYKHSGIDWLGEVPHHWAILKIKHTTYVKGRIGWQGLRFDEFTDEGPFLVTGTDFANGVVNWATCYHISEERYSEDPYIQLREGDLLITKDGTIGKLAIVRGMPYRTSLNSGVFLTRSKRPVYNNAFMYWVLSSRVFDNFIDIVKSGTTILHLYQNEFVEFSYPAPPLPEQEKIVAFLNHKTSEIDTLLDKKQGLIEKLKEKRSTLISHTVTRGLPPKATRAAGLDPHPKMKSSGIEWLGEVPAHWEVVLLKRVWAASDYGISASLSATGSVRVLTMGNVENGRILIPNDGFVDEVEPSMLLRDGDLLFNRTNSLVHVGKVGLCKELPAEPLTFASYLVRLRANRLASPAFLNYLLNMQDFLGFVRSFALPSINQANLNPTRYGQIHIPLPPIDEQRAIAYFLGEETSKIDRLIAKIEEAIERLQEYRTALITAAVSGKIDVRASQYQQLVASGASE
jgi:type I restriction enzyme, S subunit